MKLSGPNVSATAETEKIASWRVDGFIARRRQISRNQLVSLTPNDYRLFSGPNVASSWSSANEIFDCRPNLISVMRVT